MQPSCPIVKEPVICKASLSAGVDTVPHVASESNLSVFVASADRFEYTELNVKLD